MKTDAVTLKLRNAGTSLSNRVFGTAEISRVDDLVLDVPASGAPLAYVVQIGEQAGVNESEGELRQEVTESFAVIVGIDNSPDKAGHTAKQSLEDIKKEVFGAILNWTVPGYKEPIYFVSAAVWKITKPLLFYQLNFAMARWLTAEDGVSYAEGVDFAWFFAHFDMDALDLVLYGDFSEDLEWTKGDGWTIAGGQAVCDGTQAAPSSISQAVEIEDGVTYGVIFKIAEVTAGTVTPKLGTGAGTARAGAGVWYEVLTAAGGDATFYVEASADFAGKLDYAVVRAPAEHMDIPTT